MDTSLSIVHSPRSASESQDPSDETINEGLLGLGNKEEDVHHIRSLSNKVEQGPASEAVAEDRNFLTSKMNTFARRVGFGELPISISSEMELKKTEPKINPCAANIGASAESSVPASRQASCTSNGYTLESSGDSYLHRKSCHGISKLQPPDLAIKPT